MSSSISSSEQDAEVIFEAEVFSSGDDPPRSEWSSLEVSVEEENKKKVLFSKGLYTPGSGRLCAKYVAESDSAIFRHPYYKYPPVNDPGIREAIFMPEKPVIYDDNGQEHYLALCLEMNFCPVRMFHRGLLCNNIDLSFYGVNPAGIQPMAIALQYNKCVEIFNLTDNFLTDDACHHLGQMLNSNVTLQELNLAGCRIGHSGLCRLGENLHVNKTLMALNLARNNVGEEGGLEFAKQLSKGATVKRVNLSRNQLGRQSAVALAEVFEYKDKITHIDLSQNMLFHIPTTTRLLEALSCSAILREVNLSWNALEGDRIAEAIRKITRIPTMTIIDLSYNKFKGEDISIILGSLLKARQLNTVDLSFNPLGPKDASLALEKMLRPRVRLEKLLMTGVWVDKTFMLILERIKRMRCRVNFMVTFDGVLENWTIRGADPRDLWLKRADYLGNLNKKHKVDVAVFFLTLNRELRGKSIPMKDLIDRKNAVSLPLDDDLIAELADTFYGGKLGKTKLISIEDLCEYMKRIWPERKLAPPPPEPKPEPEPTLDMEEK